MRLIILYLLTQEDVYDKALQYSPVLMQQSLVRFFNSRGKLYTVFDALLYAVFISTLPNSITGLYIFSDGMSGAVVWQQKQFFWPCKMTQGYTRVSNAYTYNTLQLCDISDNVRLIKSDEVGFMYGSAVICSLTLSSWTMVK